MSSISNSKLDSIFMINCPDCHRFLNLLDHKSSKNLALEDYLKELMKNLKKSETNESFISNNMGMSYEFEGKDPHIEQKYGKYLLKNLNNNSIIDSPIASRNILSFNKKMSVTINSFDLSEKKRQDESFLSINRKKEEKIKELEHQLNELKGNGRGIEGLNETIEEMNELVRKKNGEIKRLNEFNKSLMEKLNELMRVKLL